jgi:hypothetical protein
MAKDTEKPADMDPEKLREEGQAAENERMAAETELQGGTTRGSVPWAEADKDPKAAEHDKGEAGHKARSSSAGHKAADS